MQFAISRASKDEWETVKDFQTIEQLMNFVKKNGSIIIRRNLGQGLEADANYNFTKEMSTCAYEIMIYDDYIE